MRYCPFCLTEVDDEERVCPHDHAETVATLAAAKQRSLLGHTVGTFTVSRPLARGGMGEVYVARHPTIGREVAVKVLAAESAASPGLVERFFAEARTVNVIKHENIVEVIDLASLPDGRPYLVMELLQGESLATRLRREPMLPMAEVGAILIPVLDALGAAHEAGIVHRDLKPDNVFLTQRRGRTEPKVLDFGIAKLTDRASGPGRALSTGTGQLLGTPVYMAPEQAAGRTRDLDGRSDVYAAGVILFEMCCGRPPFISDAYGEILVAHIMEPPPAPRSLRADLPEGVSAVIERALAKARDARWPGARAMGAALQRALIAAGVPAAELPEMMKAALEAAGHAEAGAMGTAEMGAQAQRTTGAESARGGGAPGQAGVVGSGTMNRAAAELLTHPPQPRPASWRWVAATAAAFVVAGASVAAILMLSAGDDDGESGEGRSKVGAVGGDRRKGAAEPAEDDETAAPKGATVTALEPESARPEGTAVADADTSAAGKGSADPKTTKKKKEKKKRSTLTAEASARPATAAAYVAPVGPVSPEEMRKTKAALTATTGTGAPKR